jgi:glyceraldehyde 3-phosphate dehydrogenase
MISIAINGFGRIGRTFLRTLLSDERARAAVRVAVINVGPIDMSAVAHLFKYDTVMGTYQGTVTSEKNHLIIDGMSILLETETDPLPNLWKPHTIDWVVDCSGQFTTRRKAEEHIRAGARAVLISAPADGDDVSIIPGVNDEAFDHAQHTIVSLGSCTTNALMTMLKLVNDACGIERAFMTTIHAYTNSQSLLDSSCDDVRRARAAAVNIIPTETGAEKMIQKIIPVLEGRVYAQAIRVPVDCVSLIDLTAMVRKKITTKELHDVFEKEARGRMKNTLELTYEPLVSSDFKGNSKSVIIDGKLTHVDDAVVKLFGWYDNEWGYSCRMRDFLMMVAEKK